MRYRVHSAPPTLFILQFAKQQTSPHNMSTDRQAFDKNVAKEAMDFDPVVMMEMMLYYKRRADTFEELYNDSTRQRNELEERNQRLYLQAQDLQMTLRDSQQAQNMLWNNNDRVWAVLNQIFSANPLIAEAYGSVARAVDDEDDTDLESDEVMEDAQDDTWGDELTFGVGPSNIRRVN